MTPTKLCTRYLVLSVSNFRDFEKQDEKNLPISPRLISFASLYYLFPLHYLETCDLYIAHSNFSVISRLLLCCHYAPPNFHPTCLWAPRYSGFIDDARMYIFGQMRRHLRRCRRPLRPCGHRFMLYFCLELPCGGRADLIPAVKSSVSFRLAHSKLSCRSFLPNFQCSQVGPISHASSYTSLSIASTRADLASGWPQAHSPYLFPGSPGPYPTWLHFYCSYLHEISWTRLQSR